MLDPRCALTVKIVHSKVITRSITGLISVFGYRH